MRVQCGKTELLGCIHDRDDIGIPLLGYMSLDLHGRCQQVVFDGEWLLFDVYLLNKFKSKVNFSGYLRSPCATAIEFNSSNKKRSNFFLS